MLWAKIVKQHFRNWPFGGYDRAEVLGSSGMWCLRVGFENDSLSTLRNWRCGDCISKADMGEGLNNWYAESPHPENATSLNTRGPDLTMTPFVVSPGPSTRAARGATTGPRSRTCTDSSGTGKLQLHDFAIWGSCFEQRPSNSIFEIDLSWRTLQNLPGPDRRGPGARDGLLGGLELLGAGHTYIYIYIYVYMHVLCVCDVLCVFI